MFQDVSSGATHCFYLTGLDICSFAVIHFSLVLLLTIDVPVTLADMSPC